MSPKAENPTHDLLGVTQVELSQQATVLLFGKLLARVPGGFLDVTGHRRRETDLHVDLAVAMEDAERLGKVGLQVEILRPVEAELFQLGRLDAINLPVTDRVLGGGRW
jgi:hypothetical protein